MTALFLLPTSQSIAYSISSRHIARLLEKPDGFWLNLALGTNAGVGLLAVVTETTGAPPIYTTLIPTGGALVFDETIVVSSTAPPVLALM